ncbi:MAG TPA: nucleotidyltransferase domain-containing protein [Methanospirillum sp.]|jgi:hypothetical protein|uniref:type VII toxin-antitoxin system MntA family adenylyltransferase antitoxin n=1 Tax=Methanospirillum sp. TaxID=45200 RepID=UPI001BD1F945|nr:nucleotidyltransferase domain-containing protein [Methanospirillum sp.]HPY60581.1 nucleotidyltransferase domain-containing protein [Methanospirillum sp.]HQC00622.1 nucleotidyltransferase domain-containing protein [Methanospirillum sp.]
MHAKMIREIDSQASMKQMKPHELSQSEKDVIIENIREFFSEQPEVIAALLFGSFAEKRFRDIDIGLFLDTSFTLPRYYEQKLERELSNLTHFPVDVRVLNNAPIRFVYQVLKKQNIILCKDISAFSSFESEILKEYLDYAYYLNKYRREVLGIS